MGNYYSGDPGSYMQVLGSTAVDTPGTTPGDSSDTYFDATEFEYLLVVCHVTSNFGTVTYTLRDADDSSGTGAADFEPTGDSGATAPSQALVFTANGQSALAAFRLHGARQFVGIRVFASGGTLTCETTLIGVRAANNRTIGALNATISTVFTTT